MTLIEQIGILTAITLFIFALYIVYLAYLDDKEQTRRIKMAKKMSMQNQARMHFEEISDQYLKEEYTRIAKKYGISVHKLIELLEMTKGNK